jgi:hypothetical protein
VGDAACALSTDVEIRGDSDQLDLGPAEEQRERAGIVGVSPEVGVQVNPH